MKKIIFLLSILFSISISAQEINWISMEEAVEAQKETPKKIIMDAYTVWCGPCKMLDKNTFHNKDVVTYINENFYAVKFNAEGNETVNFQGKEFTNPNFNPNTKGRNSSHELAQALGVRAYPTLIYFDEDANLITPIPGYQSPQQLELFLKLFKNDHHKMLKTQEDFEEYTQNFRGEFVE